MGIYTNVFSVILKDRLRAEEKLNKNKVVSPKSVVLYTALKFNKLIKSIEPF